MCPRCIWPMVICCWADGMVPMLSDSVPMEPERMTPGSATEPCSTRPTRLNCCWRMVDLQADKTGKEPEHITRQQIGDGVPSSGLECLQRVKLLGDAAHLFTVVRGHSCTTSLVFSSTLNTDSLVMPRSRGTSLFLLFIFSCRNTLK
ncbi:hypothetical protein EYF80_023001 [Liparis tanakae]|uniref:Secreted protein n=1 Tax=Liparis tanakae TaxID=230148 RepID=A0A4Z2HLH8_9TELE|nr:hypothetical protein EYF80_023001 [Liparis tanakae]